VNRRLLLVESRSGTAGALDALRRSLAADGFEVEVAPDGFYATQVLERRRPAAVLAPVRLPDMEAAELAQILSSDPELRAVRRILVPLPGEPLPDAATAARFDLVLPPETTPQQAAFRIHLALAPEPAPAPGAIEPGAPPSLSGTLGAVDFAQLAQLLAESRLAGVLGVGMPGEEAFVYFDRGEVVHCAWGALRGREAFREILRGALSGGAPFRYRRLGLPEAFRVPKTLGLPAQRLLLDSAVELDQSTAGEPPAHRGGSTGA
jgi:CheY-like chemotaxis protein